MATHAVLHFCRVDSDSDIPPSQQSGDGDGDGGGDEKVVIDDGLVCVFICSLFRLFVFLL